LFWSSATSGSNHVKILALAPPEKPVLGLESLPDAFESIRFLTPLKIQFWVWSFASYLSSLSFFMLNPKSFVLSNKTKTWKNCDHFTKTLRFWCFWDALSILQISQRGNSSGRLGSDIRGQQRILYRMMYKTSKTKIHCKLALGASYMDDSETDVHEKLQNGYDYFSPPFCWPFACGTIFGYTKEHFLPLTLAATLSWIFDCCSNAQSVRKIRKPSFWNDPFFFLHCNDLFTRAGVGLSVYLNKAYPHSHPYPRNSLRSS